MKITRVFLAAILAFFFTPGRSFSGQLELEDFVESALEKNHSIKGARQGVLSAYGESMEAYGNFFPSLSASFRGTYTDTVPELDFAMPVWADPDTGELLYEEIAMEMGQDKSYGLQLQLRQPVFTFGLVSKGYTASAHGHEIEKLSYQLRRDVFETEITKLFYGVLLAQEMLDTAKKQKALMEENLETTKAFFEAGKVSNLDVNRVRSHCLEAKSGVKKAQSSLDQSRASLFSMAVIEDTGQKLKGDLKHVEHDLDLEEVLEHAMDLRKELEIARRSVRIAEKQRDIELAQNLPHLYGFASYSYERPDQSMQDEWGGSLVVGGMIEMSLPPFSVPGQMKKVNARLKEAQAGAEDQKRKIKLQVKNSYRNLSFLHKRVSIMRENLHITGENLETASRQYDRGRITNIELNEAILDYTSARREYASALYDYIVGLEEMLLAAGK